jgi:sugar-specific transcriptional regulator TrmB
VEIILTVYHRTFPFSENEPTIGAVRFIWCVSMLILSSGKHLKSNNESVETLVQLGLSAAQAKIYLTLLQLGISSAKTVSKTSKVARPDTYKAFSELQEVGIVEKIVAAPAMFKPLPISDAVTILMLRRTKETLELNKQVNTLIEKLKESTNGKPENEEDQFVLIPKESLENKLSYFIGSSNDNVSIMISEKRLLQWVTKHSNLLEETSKRGIKVRILTDGVNELNSRKKSRT